MEWPTSCLSNPNDPNSAATLACIPKVFSNVVDWALALAGLTAVFFIIFAGFKFLTSGGDPKQVEGARKTLTYAIAGLIIIFLAFAIIKLIGVITNADCITKGFSSGKYIDFLNCQ
ncbi:MAG: pilin [Patescibacteria group bacterium]|nr:pilin [Patescibacteria group bacterium]